MAAVGTMDVEDGREAKRACTKSKEEVETERQKQLEAVPKEMGFMKEMMSSQFFIVDSIQQMNGGLFGLQAKVQETTTAVNDLKQTVDDHAARLRALEQGAGSGSSNGGGGGDGRRPPSEASSMWGGSVGNTRGRYTPAWIEVKGWVSNWNDAATRSKEFLPTSEMEKFFKNLLGMLCEDDQNAIDIKRSEQANGSRYMFGSFKFWFKANTSSDAAWIIQKRWKALYDNPDERPKMFVGMANTPQKVRFQMDSPPWKRAHIKAVGRFCGAFKQYVGTAIDIRAELGPPKTFMWTKPSDRMVRSICIAEYSETSGRWLIYTDMWDSMRQTLGLMATGPDAATQMSRVN